MERRAKPPRWPAQRFIARRRLAETQVLTSEYQRLAGAGGTSPIDGDSAPEGADGAALSG
jgi:hypothetical protein